MTDGALEQLSGLAADHDALVTLAPSTARRGRGTGGHLRVGGLHAVNRRVIEALRDVRVAACEDRLFAAIDAVADAGGVVHALMTDAWWFHTADAEDQLAVNRAALDLLEPGERDVLPGSRIEGRVEIHPDARVEASIVRGPVIVGAHARIVDAYVGPYTAIGEAATVENAEIENSIVHTGARIQHAGVRLEASVIGQGATVGRSFDLPRAAQLVVGEDAWVALA